LEEPPTPIEGRKNRRITKPEERVDILLANRCGGVRTNTEVPE